MELKNFTALGRGFPSGHSLPALTRIATSSVEQFNSLATCSASNRAGKSFAAHAPIRPACVSMEEAADIFGWPNYYLPFLVRAGHLKPLGKPAPNARKWFATVEIERMSCDPDWLDKAIRIVEKQIQEMNKKQKVKEPETALV